jgi:hypothetical protein
MYKLRIIMKMTEILLKRLLTTVLFVSTFVGTTNATAPDTVNRRRRTRTSDVRVVLLPAALKQFDGWELEDHSLPFQISDTLMTFSISGVAKESIPARSLRTLPAHDKRDVCTCIFLCNLERGKRFVAHTMWLPSAGVVVVCPASASGGVKGKADLVLVSKRDLRLRLISLSGDSVMLTLPAATGLNAGDKRKEGDKKTPEGLFTVYAIHDASGWDYDFHDGKGRIKGTYGKYFIRFREHYHIGIHGTHLPETVGTRATEGCVRLRNSDIERIVPMISVAKTLIAVTPAYDDLAATSALTAQNTQNAK